MANQMNNVCDLCQQYCEGPIRYAHKPYIFHFYHEKQYKQALEEYELENEDTDNDVNNNNNYANNGGVGLTGKGDDEETEENEREVEDEEDSSDRHTSEDEEEEKRESEEPEGDEDVSEGYYDEEREPLLSSEEDLHEEEVSDEDMEVKQEGTENDDEEEMEGKEGNEEEEQMEGKESNEEEEQMEGKESNEEEREENQQEGEDIKYLLIPAPVITSIISDTKGTIDKSLDFTMATGIAIMAGIASMTSSNQNNEWGTPTSHIVLDTISTTCIGTTLAVVGIAAGVKELMNAVQESGPQLPMCQHCKRCELQGSGCQTFCEICGKCEQDSYWKDGTEETHCLTICNNCNTNCVVCEAKVATVKRHHKAFSKSVHGHLSTRLYGTYREARIIGSSLIIAGILSCTLPGIGWAWGLSLIAGSVIANTGIRIIAKPTVRIRCDSCNLEEEAEYFQESTGCQQWCQCCGVLDETEGERYCLALCEDCSHE